MYTFLPPSCFQALPPANLCQLTDYTVATSFCILIKHKLNLREPGNVSTLLDTSYSGTPT